MKGIEALVVIAIAVPIAIFVIWMKAKHARRTFEAYIAGSGWNAEVVRISPPPLRLWLKNRKGDSWGLIRFADGTERWARYRNRIFFSGSSIELFD
ncbi:MAG: hypothetical protein SFX72_18955 [Isosphaeraceae bacterium]|nr:hypothetical protein [Isosphaeraceae bacterium]